MLQGDGASSPTSRSNTCQRRLPLPVFADVLSMHIHSYTKESDGVRSCRTCCAAVPFLQLRSRLTSSSASFLANQSRMRASRNNQVPHNLLQSNRPASFGGLVHHDLIAARRPPFRSLEMSRAHVRPGQDKKHGIALICPNREKHFQNYNRHKCNTAEMVLRRTSRSLFEQDIDSSIGIAKTCALYKEVVVNESDLWETPHSLLSTINSAT